MVSPFLPITRPTCDKYYRRWWEEVEEAGRNSRNECESRAAWPVREGKDPAPA
jgi:hypothetical protein